MPFEATVKMAGFLIVFRTTRDLHAHLLYAVSIAGQ